MKAVLLVLLFAVPCAAQTPEAMAWTGGHQDIADWLGTIGVAGQAAAVTVSAWRNQERGKALSRVGCQMGIAVGISELLKATVRETRPDGSDRKSFPSEHTFIGTALGPSTHSGWNYSLQVPLAAFIGLSRSAANKHHLWPDVAAGWAFGAGTQALCHALFKTKD